MVLALFLKRYIAARSAHDMIQRIEVKNLDRFIGYLGNVETEEKDSQSPKK